MRGVLYVVNTLLAHLQAMEGRCSRSRDEGKGPALRFLCGSWESRTPAIHRFAAGREDHLPRGRARPQHAGSWSAGDTTDGAPPGRRCSSTGSRCGAVPLLPMGARAAGRGDRETPKAERFKACGGADDRWGDPSKGKTDSAKRPFTIEFVWKETPAELRAETEPESARRPRASAPSGAGRRRTTGQSAAGAPRREAAAETRPVGLIIARRLRSKRTYFGFPRTG